MENAYASPRLSVRTLGAWLLAAGACAPSAGTTPAPAPHTPLSLPAVSEVAAIEERAPEPSAPAPEEVTPAPEVAAAQPQGPRIGSVRVKTWIYQSPSKSARAVGFLREGMSVALRAPEPVKAGGCKGGWYAVEPYGFVCNDGTTTLDLSDPLFTALAESAPTTNERLRYAFSDNAPMYTRLPSLAEQERVEGPPAQRKPYKLGSWANSHQELAVDERVAPTDEVPGFLDGMTASPAWGKALVRKWIPPGSMLAFTHAFEANGRTWLLSPDLTLVPADRVRAFRRSSFRGVQLGEGGASLPIAWSRREAVSLYRKIADDFVVAEDERMAPRTWVSLTGERVERGSKTFLALKTEGLWVLEGDVSVASARASLPATMAEDEKWIEVKIRAGTLVAYRGATPIFTTLVSPGVGGFGASSASNAQLVKQSATPLGVYRVHWKTRASHMSPEKGDPQKFWIADVPDTLYFRAPFAIHTAYWHEDFGNFKSAGCVNVSPEDGKTLFSWADPPLPEGWQGVAPSKEGGAGTLIVISP